VADRTAGGVLLGLAALCAGAFLALYPRASGRVDAGESKEFKP